MQEMHSLCLLNKRFERIFGLTLCLSCSAAQNLNTPTMIQIAGGAQKFEGDGPLFSVGQIVQHRRYHYRGVIVAFDEQCQADMDWYKSNQSQPDRAQPWYHVLVDRATHHTYVAESNLIVAPDQSEIGHPYLEAFFKEFVGGLYVRNDRAWPA